MPEQSQVASKDSGRRYFMAETYWFPAAIPGRLTLGPGNEIISPPARVLEPGAVPALLIVTIPAGFLPFFNPPFCQQQLDTPPWCH
jgi:hypothetical protein